jgi:hypothetical protein
VQLKFGTFIAPYHPLRESPLTTYERDLELIEWCDRWGFDEAPTCAESAATSASKHRGSRQRRAARSVAGVVVAMKFSRISATAIGASTCGKWPIPSSTSRRLPVSASCAA